MLDGERDAAAWDECAGNPGHDRIQIGDTSFIGQILDGMDPKQLRGLIDEAPHGPGQATAQRLADALEPDAGRVPLDGEQLEPATQLVPA